MSFLRKKKWWQHPIALRVFSVVLLALAAFLTVSVFERYQIERDMAERRYATESELEALEERKEALKEKVEYLRDDRGVEAEMRKHFDVAREGEQVVVLVDNNRPVSESIATSSEPEPRPWSFWAWLWPW